MHSLVKRINKIKYNKDSNIKTFTSKTHGLKNIIFYNKRLKTLRLTWCKQICDLIENIYPQKKIKINDIGCCYFQLYKEIKLRKLNYNYYGYDIDEKFIKLGLSQFPELLKKFKVANVEKIIPRKTNITVLSATLQHCENPLKLLKNVFESTKDLIILRTWSGDKSKIQLINDRKLVKVPLFINQYSYGDIANIFIKNNFYPSFIQDKATNNSKSFKIYKNKKIYRKMLVILGERVNL
jgi:SAM-dependent methyltransferase